MISVIELLILILVTASFCFISFQMWYYIENYNYILKFNTTYSNLEFASSPSLDYVDKSFYDPNDVILNINDKWRCVNDNITNKIYSVSSYGFISDSSTENKSWNFLKDCILDTFNTKSPIVYNPCADSPQSYDCSLYNKLIKER